MAIIVEGFDNSGKSTLAKLLAEKLNCRVLHPGPRPKSALEETKCLQDQLAQASESDVIMDRVTAISSPAYSSCMTLQHWDYLTRMVRIPGLKIIYCRPPMNRILDFSTHVSKSYDEEKHLRRLSIEGPSIVSRYDHIMSRIPHVPYDWTNPDMHGPINSLMHLLGRKR